MTAKAAAQPPVEDPRIAQRERLQAERERLKAVREAQTMRPPIGVTWRPSPSQGENDITVVRTVVALKVHDLSPVDPQSFDPTPGPAMPVPPVMSAPPVITPLTDLVVGAQLIGAQGTWSGSPIYIRQWRRGALDIVGATAITYNLVAEDVGQMVGLSVRTMNAAGSASADAVPVGPIVEAA